MPGALQTQPVSSIPQGTLTLPGPRSAVVVADSFGSNLVRLLFVRSAKDWQCLTYFPFLLCPCLVGLDGAQKFAWIAEHQVSTSLALGLWGIWSVIALLNPVWLYAGQKNLIASMFPPRLWVAIANIAMSLAMLTWMGHSFPR